VILPDFILPSRVNQHWKYSGLDSPDQCVDKQHFADYPFAVEYNYNSRGFRDQEWPSTVEELKNGVWCVGDSFTVGLGSPIEHTWPRLLEKKLSTRTINVSMDGASNSWIARKVLGLVAEIQPKIIVVQWSYLFRDENSNTELDDEQRRQPYNDQTLMLSSAQLLEKFVQLVNHVEQHKNTTIIVHSFIPGFYFSTTAQDEWLKLSGSNWPALPQNTKLFAELPAFVRDELTVFGQYDIFRLYADLLSGTEKYVEEFVKQDLARDGYHYDLITATGFVNAVCEQLHNRTV
jgi:hypothetical protein